MTRSLYPDGTLTVEQIAYMRTYHTLAMVLNTQISTPNWCYGPQHTSFCFQVTSSINNLIMGKIYIEHTGIMKISNVQSTMVARLKFKESGRLSSKDTHQVRIQLVPQ